MTFKFVDNVELSGVRRTADGYLVADVRCARTGCQQYHASELGLIGDQMVTVYRPEEAVMNKTDSWTTYVGKPVTMDHPSEPVTADNWKKYAVGDIGEEIAREGEYVRVSIKLMDANAISDVLTGKRQISMGYTSPVQMADGVAPDGTSYQAVQTGPIRINHLAIVDRARGGAELRVGDAGQWGIAPTTQSKLKEDKMSDALKTVVLGDAAVQVALADVAALDKFKADSAKMLADAKADYDKEMAKKDAEMAKKDAELAKLKEDQLSDADIDARVSARADLIDRARKVHADGEFSGKTDAEIRKDAVVAALGDAAVKDRSDAYIEAMFDLQVNAAPAAAPGGDPLRQTIQKDGLKSNHDSGGWGDSVFSKAGVATRKGA